MRCRFLQIMCPSYSKCLLTPFQSIINNKFNFVFNLMHLSSFLTWQFFFFFFLVCVLMFSRFINFTLLSPCLVLFVLQRLIFDKPKDGIRKIVLATNMAETSITINDVVFVVDCGKAKETSYDALNNTPCLLPSWISKASARQVY